MIELAIVRKADLTCLLTHSGTDEDWAAAMARVKAVMDGPDVGQWAAYFDSLVGRLRFRPEGDPATLSWMAAHIRRARGDDCGDRLNADGTITRRAP